MTTKYKFLYISVFNDSTLWITGGEDGANYLKSTEFVFVNQPPIEGPVNILGQKDLNNSNG